MSKEPMSVWRVPQTFAGIVGVFITLYLIDGIGDAGGWYDLLPEDHSSAESLNDFLILEAGILGVMTASEAMRRITDD